jgi:hypothetical protein
MRQSEIENDIYESTPPLTIGGFGYADLGYDQFPQLKQWLQTHLPDMLADPTTASRLHAVDLGTGTGAGSAALMELGVPSRQITRVDLFRYDSDQCPQIPVIGIYLALLTQALSNEKILPQPVKDLEGCADLVLIVNGVNRITGAATFFGKLNAILANVSTLDGYLDSDHQTTGSVRPLNPTIAK